LIASTASRRNASSSDRTIWNSFRAKPGRIASRDDGVGADSALRPLPSTWCNACYGQRWWTERQQPAGWRCTTCHPPTHLAPERVEIVGP
jgi:hypothetical protein